MRSTGVTERTLELESTAEQAPRGHGDYPQVVPGAIQACQSTLHTSLGWGLSIYTAAQPASRVPRRFFTSPQAW